TQRRLSSSMLRAWFSISCANESRSPHGSGTAHASRARSSPRSSAPGAPPSPLAPEPPPSPAPPPVPAPPPLGPSFSPTQAAIAPSVTPTQTHEEKRIVHSGSPERPRPGVQGGLPLRDLAAACGGPAAFPPLPRGLPSARGAAAAARLPLTL